MDERVSSDQLLEIRAATWNELLGLRDRFRQRGNASTLGAPPQTPQFDSNVVWIKNSTGGQLRLGEVVELQTKLLTTVERYVPWFDADVPDLTGPYVVCLEPIGTGAIGPAQIAGVCPALVTVDSTSDRWADVESGQDTLQSGASGPVRLLYPPPSTGEHLMFVHLSADPAEPGEIVQLNHASATAGDIVAANASGVHPARIKTWNGAGYDNGDAVWLLLTDYYDVDAGDVIGEHGKYYGPAKAAGLFTVSSDERPLYIAKVGDQTFLGKNSGSEIAKGSSGTIDLWHRATEVDSGITKTCKALGAAIPPDKFVTVQRIASHWYVGCYEP